MRRPKSVKAKSHKSGSFKGETGEYFYCEQEKDCGGWPEKRLFYMESMDVWWCERCHFDAWIRPRLVSVKEAKDWSMLDD